MGLPEEYLWVTTWKENWSKNYNKMEAAILIGRLSIQNKKVIDIEK